MLKQIIALVIVSLTLVTNFTVLKYLSKSNPEILSYLFKDVANDWKEQDKFQFLLKVAGIFGALQSLSILLTGIGRGASGKPNPVQHQDTQLVVTMNRVMQNQIEQFCIFFPLLSYWTYYKNAEKELAFTLATGFFIGRVIFAIGYTVGQAIRIPTLRGPGFLLNLICTTIVGFKCFGIDILDYNPLK